MMVTSAGSCRTGEVGAGGGGGGNSGTGVC